VFVDQTSIGWYSSFYLSSFYTPDTVAHQARYQSAVPSAVLLVYDNVRTAQGHLALRALRLTETAMAAYRTAVSDVMRSGKAGGDPDRIDKAVVGHEAFASLAPSQLFEEVPIKIHNPHIVQALLVDLVDTAGMTAPATTAATGLGSGASAATVTTGAGTIGGAAVAGAIAGAGAGSAAPITEDTDFARLDLSTGSSHERREREASDGGKRKDASCC
jgi:hypothetical protein